MDAIIVADDSTIIQNIVEKGIGEGYKVLKAKHGNCVDQAHLVVAMCRCAGLPAMYSHGTCHFSSGNTYGHVWGMVLIGNTWTVVDPVSTRNSLGKVVNWNTNSFVFKGYHQSISF